MEKKQIR